MDNIYIYYVDLPNNVKEIITPCYDGYTVYINKRLPREAKKRAYNHAVRHIQRDDFHKTDVQAIEYQNHEVKDGII